MPGAGLAQPVRGERHVPALHQAQRLLGVLGRQRGVPRGIAGTAAQGPRGAELGQLGGALAPWSNDRSYLNFAENEVDPSTAYGATARRQLAGIRSAVDPGGVFVANHRVPRLFEDGRPTT